VSASIRRHGDELIAERQLDAPPDRVWTAFTTPEHLAAFWGGRHATVPAGSVRVDLRTGGRFTLETHAPDGRTSSLEFVYEEIEPPTLLVLREPRTGLRTSIQILASGAGSTLTVHQRLLPPELRTAEAATGLGGILDRLAEHLDAQAAS
jgi:uncharacterized protein YndB with AHSA1/START domain